MAKKLTIIDVARLAGVSKATVSRVLNGNTSVDPALRERVLQIVKEHDFVPSINALGLNGRSQLLGILMPRYLWAALQEITWAVAGYISTDTRYEIIFYSCSSEEGYTRVIDQIVKTNLVAGLVATLYDQSPTYLEDLYRQGFPVVLVDTVGIQSQLPTICANHYQGAYEAVQHLLELGHRRIGYIHGTKTWPCSVERYRAYCDALRAAGIEPDPTLFQQGDFTPEGGTVAARLLLDLEERPTAIFAINDDMAHGTMVAAQERNLRIPEDLSLIGFNDDPIPLLRSRLTTVHQPFADMARCAAEILIAMLQPHHIFSEEWQRIMATTSHPIAAKSLEELPTPLKIEFPTHLVVRSTCIAV